MQLNAACIDVHSLPSNQRGVGAVLGWLDHAGEVARAASIQVMVIGGGGRCWTAVCQLVVCSSGVTWTANYERMACSFLHSSPIHSSPIHWLTFPPETRCTSRGGGGSLSCKHLWATCGKWSSAPWACCCPWFSFCCLWSTTKGSLSVGWSSYSSVQYNALHTLFGS